MLRDNANRGFLHSSLAMSYHGLIASYTWSPLCHGLSFSHLHMALSREDALRVARRATQLTYECIEYELRRRDVCTKELSDQVEGLERRK
jgi:hypothetical protein